MALLRSFCFSCTLRSGALFLGIMTLIAGLLGVVIISITLAMWDELKGEFQKEYPDSDVYIKVLLTFFIVALVFTVLNVIIATLLIVGIKTVRPKLMIPYIVVEVLGIIGGIVMDIVSGVIGTLGPKDLASGIPSIIIAVYFTLIVYSYYQELTEQRRASKLAQGNNFTPAVCEAPSYQCAYAANA